MLREILVPQPWSRATDPWRTPQAAHLLLVKEVSVFRLAQTTGNCPIPKALPKNEKGQRSADSCLSSFFIDLKILKQEFTLKLQFSY